MGETLNRVSTIITATDLPAPMSPQGPYRVALVCTGNICRSAMAHVVLTDRLACAGLPADGRDGVVVTSSGISDEERGNPIDRRARRVLEEQGYGQGGGAVADQVARMIASHRAHRITDEELETSDLILAMTSQHRRVLLHRAVQLEADADRILLFRELDPAADLPRAGITGYAALDVPDPWYGTQEDFVDTLDVVERVGDALAAALVELAAARR